MEEAPLRSSHNGTGKNVDSKAQLGKSLNINNLQYFMEIYKNQYENTL